jgi:teichuronic acid biosynthesis glycosyltransferase TuaC
MAARVLVLPHVRSFAPDLIFSFFLYPDCYAALKIGKALSVPVVAMEHWVRHQQDRRSHFGLAHAHGFARGRFLVAGQRRPAQEGCGHGCSANEKTRAIVNGCDLSVFRVMDRLEARQQLRIDPAEGGRRLHRADGREERSSRTGRGGGVAASPAAQAAASTWSAKGRTSKIESAIQARNAASYIHALQGCAFDDVAVWMAAADLVTLPSYMEGCPNVVLEALACGRPVVATNVGGIPEIMNTSADGSCPLAIRPRWLRRSGIGPRQNLGRRGHLRAREPKLERRGG